MSIYKNGKLIAGGRQCMPLLSFMWSDHVLNDASWLRADTFSWQNGSVYQAVYQHLVEDYDNGPLESETINGQLIYFHRAPDGHKVVIVYDDDTHHKAVETIYNSTGVAWYYILDTTNQRFKLPRTKFGFTGLRSVVGGYIAAGLPNITGGIGLSTTQMSSSGAFTHWQSGGAQGWDGWNSYGNRGFNFDASRSSSVYGNSDTVQPKATEMYLYFYVGNFTQTALENTAGLNAELFNGKADLNLSNTASNIDFVVESQEPTSANDYTWYRKYKSGWVEQGGWRNNYGGTITFPIAMSLTNQYTAILVHNGNTAKGEGFVHCYNKTSTGMSYSLSVSTSGMAYVSWQVSGMAA